jgi:curved DNA-binding protein CbpA
MDSSGVNPFKVLNIGKHFTLDQLREQYKKIALKVHPDKGGSNELFQLVTLCYKKLLKYHQRRIEKDYAELKTEFQQFTEEQRGQVNPDLTAFVERAPTAATATAAPERQRATDTNNGESFNNKFNRLFEETRLENPMDGGYGHLMEKSNGSREDISIPRMRGNYNEEKFNKAFERQTINNTNREVVSYKPPEPLLMAKKLAFTELGVDQVDDFSGQNNSLKQLNYSDYMKAHSTSKLIDPRMVRQRAEYRNVEELERHRSQAPVMTDAEQREYSTLLEKQAELERKRQYQLSMQDQRWASHAEKVQQRTLTYFQR